MAPYRFTFETHTGERLGIIVYAFFANSLTTRNRPMDEHRFQVKYAGDTKAFHNLWQDPFLLYTTLFCGIDPERGIFVGADPLIHSPTRFFISIEFKQRHVDAIQQHQWHAWERDRKAGSDDPIEVLVGGTSASFLRYVRFEREALGESQGHRQLLAETTLSRSGVQDQSPTAIPAPIPPPSTLHALAIEFQLSEQEVLNLIANARRLKMAVRGWVAEEHLVRQLRAVRGVEKCDRNDTEGHADVDVLFTGVPLTVECKNVLRQRTAAGLARIDFQRTRASKRNPWSRFYGPEEFDLVAACLHAVEQSWTFRFALSADLDRHPKCTTKLSNNVRIDERWGNDATVALTVAAQKKS